MLILYLPPERGSSEDDQLYQAGVALREYVDDLADFPAEILRAGWLKTRRAHRGAGWPKPEVIRAACSAEQPLPPPRLAAATAAGGFGPMADQWLESPPGQQALREGIGWDCRHLIERTGHHPSPRDIDKARIALERLRRLADDPAAAEAAGVASQYETIRGWVDSIGRREEILRRRFLAET